MNKASKTINFGQQPIETPRVSDTGNSMVSCASVPKRKDPNQEFFKMCLVSFQMNNQDDEFVYEMDHRKLWKKCAIDEKKEFYQFQEWIQKEAKK